MGEWVLPQRWHLCAGPFQERLVVQQQKRKTVDTALCDRCVQALKDMRYGRLLAAKESGLKSRSQLSEIERYVTEPSKRIINWLIDRGYSAQWVLRGQGPMRWTEIDQSLKEVARYKKNNAALTKEIDKKNGEIEALHKVVEKFTARKSMKS